MSDHRCHAIGCATTVPRDYFMCPPHWRLVPPEVKRAWRDSMADYSAASDEGRREAARALIENKAEVLRIVAAIEAGVPA